MGANCSTCRNQAKDNDFVLVSSESFRSMDRIKSKTRFEINEEKQKELSLALLSKFTGKNIEGIIKIQAYFRKYAFKISESNLEITKSRALLKPVINLDNQVSDDSKPELLEINELHEIKIENGQSQQLINDIEENKIVENLKNGMDQSSSNCQVEMDHPNGDAGADEPRSELLVNSKEPVNSLDNQLRDSKASVFDFNQDELILINNLEDYNVLSHGNRMSDIPEFIEKEEVANSCKTVKTRRSEISENTNLNLKTDEKIENNKSIEIEKIGDKNPESNMISETNVYCDPKNDEILKTVISLENIDPNKLTNETIIHNPQLLSEQNSNLYIKDKNNLLNITNEVDLQIEVNKNEIISSNQTDQKYLARSFPNFEEIKTIISPREVEPGMKDNYENEPKDLNNLLDSLNGVIRTNPNITENYKCERPSLEISIPERVAQSCESFFIRPSYESHNPTPTNQSNPFSHANNFNQTFQDHHQDHLIYNSEYHDRENFSVLSDVNSITTNKVRRVVRTIVKKVVRVSTTNEKREEFVQNQIRRAVSIMIVLKNKSRRNKFILMRHFFRIWKEESKENISHIKHEANLKFLKMRESKIKIILKRNFKNNLHSRFYQWYKQILKIRNLTHLGISIVKKIIYYKDKKIVSELFGRLLKYNKSLKEREELMKAREIAMNKIIITKMTKSNKRVLNHRYKLWKQFVSEEKQKITNSHYEVKIILN
jgi:hypothetical protein